MRKGLRKWTFERKYYRLPSWWKNFQHRLDTPGRRSWRRWYFWASGGQWLKAEAEMLKGWGIWTHRCRHLTGGLRKGPLMWRGMWEIAQGKFHSPRYPKIQMKSQVQTSLWRIKECTSMLKVSFTQGLKRTESAFFFFFYDRISKDCRQLNQHNKTSSFSNKGSRGSGVLCHLHEASLMRTMNMCQSLQSILPGFEAPKTGAKALRAREGARPAVHAGSARRGQTTL